MWTSNPRIRIEVSFAIARPQTGHLSLPLTRSAQHRDDAVRPGELQALATAAETERAEHHITARSE